MADATVATLPGGTGGVQSVEGKGGDSRRHVRRSEVGRPFLIAAATVSLPGTKKSDALGHRLSQLNL